jgi:sulfate adenylyltransferase
VHGAILPGATAGRHLGRALIAPAKVEGKVSLVPGHGGLDAPVYRFLPLSKRKALFAAAASMPKIALAEAELATLYRISDGTLSPLTGFMDQRTYDQVLDQKHVVSKGGKYAWTIPLSLPATAAEVAALQVGKVAALTDNAGNVVGTIEVSSIFDWDKPRYVEKVYRTTRLDHPGAKIVTDDPRTHLVGGVVNAFRPAPHPDYGHLVLAPVQTRALIASRGWEKALAFQTRNPLHRAHEYALVYGVEELTRQGHFAGCVLNPLVGQLKNDDVNAVTRMRTYRGLRDKALIGQGDVRQEIWDQAGYQINEVFDLIGLDMRMFYGGPSEAVMHSIYRQNHGFTNLVIGRKHADAPFFDGTSIWGDFDAQEIFGNLEGDLKVQPVKVGFAAYYESVGRVDLVERHPDEKPFSISGTKIRELLVAGERPDARIMRPETADILSAAYRAKA